VHSTLEPCEDSDFTFPVHFNLREHTIYVRCRPYLKEFLERVASMFEIIIFTASQSIYAEQLLNVLDPKRKLFRHRVYRDSCVYVEGNYLKDLTVLGRDLSRVVIIDNSPQVCTKPHTFCYSQINCFACLKISEILFKPISYHGFLCTCFSYVFCTINQFYVE
jgi:Dullard-like phosphatase family protein